MKIKDIKTVFSYAKPYRLQIFISIILTILSQICALLLPGCMAKIVDIGIRQRGIENYDAIADNLLPEQIFSIQTSYIVKIGLIMILVGAACAILSMFAQYISTKISSGISADLRKDVFLTVLNLPFQEMDKLSVSSLINRATNDVEYINYIIMMSVNIFTPPMLIVGGIILAYQKSASMSWTMALGAFFAAAFVVVSSRMILPKVQVIRGLIDKINLVLKERLSGVINARTFGCESFEHDKYHKSNTEIKNIALYINRITSLTSPIIIVSMNFVNMLIIWLGANEIMQSKMKIGDVMAFMQYSSMVVGAFMMLNMIINVIPQSWVCVKRVIEILDKKQLPVTDELNLPNDDNVSVEFKNVSFKYRGAEECAIENVNFSTSAGQTVGIIGTTGSGKSTLLKLIMGFYKSTDGTVLINGHNVKNISAASISKIIGYVPQDGLLFSGNIAENLRFGNDFATDDELYKVCEVAGISELVKDHGLQGDVAQLGANFSGGQRQRLAIARALAGNYKIYIFDDSFSKLDFKTDAKIRKSLSEFLTNSISFIVSQRISTIKSCDIILVLDQGKIIAQGTHDELLKSCEIYAQTYDLQMGVSQNA